MLTVVMEVTNEDHKARDMASRKVDIKALELERNG